MGVGGRGLVFIVSSGRQWWVAVHPSAGMVLASPVGPHPRLWVGGGERRCKKGSAVSVTGGCLSRRELQGGVAQALG